MTTPPDAPLNDGDAAGGDTDMRPGGPDASPLRDLTGNPITQSFAIPAGFLEEENQGADTAADGGALTSAPDLPPSEPEGEAKTEQPEKTTEDSLAPEVLEEEAPPPVDAEDAEEPQQHQPAVAGEEWVAPEGTYVPWDELELTFAGEERPEPTPGGAPAGRDEALAILGSLLFVAPQPLTSQRLQAILGGLTAESLRQLLFHLGERLRPLGLYVSEVAGGFQIATRGENADWVWKLVRRRQRVSLSPQALETLAIVAYKQPVTKGEVDIVRGMESGPILRHLVEQEFIEVTGRKEVPGRPLLYGSTRLFLKTFGLNSVNDLPAVSELKKLYSERERRRLEVEAGEARERRDQDRREAETRMARYRVPVTEVARPLTGAEKRLFELERQRPNQDELDDDDDRRPTLQEPVAAALDRQDRNTR